MAPRRGKESPLDLCNRATVLGNTISVRMLEYLSTAKNYPHGFRELAGDFLDTCRILWSIEAGLMEASRTHHSMPVDMVQELDKKFRQVNDDFILLNQTLHKFLDYERKGALGKIQKGFRMMFADTDIDKMRESLAKSRDVLRMSAVVFRWSLGDERADASVGIGYTGLIAALERMNQGRSQTTTIPPLHPPPASDPPEIPPQQSPHPPQHPPPATPIKRGSIPNLSPPHEDGLPPLPPLLDRQSSWRAPSTRSSELTTHSSVSDSLVFRRTAGTLQSTEVATEDHSSDSTESRTLIESQIHDLDITGKFPQVMRLKVDPTTVPRWSPRQTTGANSPELKAGLMVAVQQKNHKSIEQLLDCGVRMDAVTTASMLRRAAANKDLETMRLLLLFNADANTPDKEGWTPLYAATKSLFLDGAKLLIKYGADPNLSAGPDSDSPLSYAVSDNIVDFVHLFLMYGGDATKILENGNTALIRGMNKNASSRMVELMLNYDSDPNSKNAEGKTPLFEAISANRIDLMTLLLDHGADPNLPGPKHMLWPSIWQPKALQLLLARGADHKKTPGIMELASSIKNIESIRILLEAGVSPNIRKDGTYTPLCSAIRDNSLEIVTLLLNNGADPNMMASEYPAWKCVTHHRTHVLPQLIAAGADLHNPKGIIEKAVAHNNMEALLFLLEKGVNPNDRSPEGRTPLTTAIRDDRGEIVDLLLAKGANPGVRGQDWPICMAVKRPQILKKLLPHVVNPRAVKGVMEMAVVANELDSIKLLLEAGVSVEDKNGGVFSPLTTAIREHRKDIVRYLLDEAGADPNAPGEHLPIIKAIRRYNGHDTEILQMLLARGSDINLMYRGWNAVLQAVESGDYEILKLLVEMGDPVDLQAQDESGRTVVEIVTERGWDEAVTLLIGNGEARQ